MLIWLSFYRKILKGDILIEVEQNALEEEEDVQINEQDWDIISPQKPVPSNQQDIEEVKEYDIPHNKPQIPITVKQHSGEKFNY